MNYLKKFLAITLIFVMQFQSVHASVAVGGGWGLNLIRVENSTSIFTAFKDGFQSTVAISPSSAQVVKSLLRGGLVGLALSAVTQALLDGVDYVMDSAKQELRYKKTVCGDGVSCLYSPYRYSSSTLGNLGYFSSIDSLVNSFASSIQKNNPDARIKIKPFVQDNYSDRNIGYFAVELIYHDDYVSSIAVSRVLRGDNPFYNPSAKPDIKSIPLTTLATQIINLAEQGNPEAKAYIASVVQDMLEHDEDYRKSLEAQLDAKLKEAQKEKKKPCITVSGKVVPVGTYGYRHDKVPPSKPHYPFTGDHYNLYKANQNPNNGKCFWVESGASDASNGQLPPPNSIPIEPFI